MKKTTGNNVNMCRRAREGVTNLTPEELARYVRIQTAWEQREHPNSHIGLMEIVWLGDMVCQEAFLPASDAMTWFWQTIPGPRVHGMPPITLDVIF